MNIDELIARLERDIELSHEHKPIVKEDYYRENALLWDRHKKAITALREQQEQLTAPLPDEVKEWLICLRDDNGGLDSGECEEVADLIERLARENAALMDENVWLQKAEQRIEEQDRMLNNLIEIMTGGCEKHTGERTPDRVTFFKKYSGCAVCRVERIEELEGTIEQQGTCNDFQRDKLKLAERQRDAALAALDRFAIGEFPMSSPSMLKSIESAAESEATRIRAMGED